MNNKINVRFFMEGKSGRGQIQLVASCNRRRFRSASWTVGEVQDFIQLSPNGTVSVPAPTAGALWLQDRLLLVRRATLNAVTALVRNGEWSRLRPWEFRIWISAAIMLEEREAMKRRGKKADYKKVKRGISENTINCAHIIKLTYETKSR